MRPGSSLTASLLGLLLLLLSGPHPIVVGAARVKAVDDNINNNERTATSSHYHLRHLMSSMSSGKSGSKSSSRFPRHKCVPFPGTDNNNNTAPANRVASWSSSMSSMSSSKKYTPLQQVAAQGTSASLPIGAASFPSRNSNSMSSMSSMSKKKKKKTRNLLLAGSRTLGMRSKKSKRNQKLTRAEKKAARAQKKAARQKAAAQQQQNYPALQPKTYYCPPPYLEVDIPWTTTATGLLGDGGWVVSNTTTDTTTSLLRFNVEDSADGTCGGLNGNIQTGTATATNLTLPYTAELTVLIRGMGEPLTADQEQMIVSVDGVPISTASNVAAVTSFACNAVPIVQSLQQTIVLQADTPYTVDVAFNTTTGDNHQDVFFEARFSFKSLYDGDDEW
mmetsp:Transcript_11740/g.23867  ORF Transcript_11740/g.23867 Transcript_11740/m.23867 type:complete len:390 (+) Transcript_11740:204-1373(+)